MGLFSRSYRWVEFTLNPLSSLQRWLAVCGIIFLTLLTELITFYLSFILWVPIKHWLHVVRLCFMALWSAVSVREVFQLLDDPDFGTLGRQSWIFLWIICTEVLICVKFGWDIITKPLPIPIILWWLSFGFGLLVYAAVKFYLYKPIMLKEPKVKQLVYGSTDNDKLKKL